MKTKITLSLLFLCSIAVAQLEPIVTDAQIKKNNVASLKVVLYNADSLGNKHGEGETERYYEYSKEGQLEEKNFYPEEPAHNRITIYEYKGGKLWRESVNRHGELVESIEYKIDKKTGLATKIEFTNSNGQTEAVEEMDYVNGQLVDYRMYNDAKDLMLTRKFHYKPGTDLITKETEDRGGYKRTIAENKYDANNRMIERKEYDNVGDLKHTITYTYDSNGSKTKQVTMKPNGKLEEELTFIYNSKNQLVEEYVKHEGITLRDSRHYEYDSKGLHVKTTAFEATTHHWRLVEIQYTYH